MLKKTNYLCLSPVLFLLGVTATGLGISQPVRGETSETILPTTEVNRQQATGKETSETILPTTEVNSTTSVTPVSSPNSQPQSFLQGKNFEILNSQEVEVSSWQTQNQGISASNPNLNLLEANQDSEGEILFSKTPSVTEINESQSSLSPEIDEIEENQPLISQIPDLEDNEESENLPQLMETETPELDESETPDFPEIPTTPPEDLESPVEPETPTIPPIESPQTEIEEEARVLVAEIVVTGADLELENLVYNTIRTRPGRTTTRSQLQEDINAIYTTGFFANVRVIPEDTPLGVRVTFAVTPNPVLREIQVETVPKREEKGVLPPEVIEETFGEQYGKIINLRDLQQGITRINEWYSSNGYDLAQVVGSPTVSEDGVVTLVIAEGVIENIQVKFYDSEDEPVNGRTRDFIITREMRLKPGDVFNRNTAQQDLQRVFGLGLFEDVRLSFEPAIDPREVIVNVDVVEGNTGSVAAGAGFGSTSGFFGTLSYQQQNLGGNNHTIGAEIQVGERELLFDLSFTDPWIATDPFRTAYTVNAFRRRSISLVYDGVDTSVRTARGSDSPRVVRTGGGVTFLRPIAEDVFSKPDWILSAGMTYQNVRIENSNGDLSPRSRPIDGFQRLAFSNSGIDDLWTFTFTASQDERDNPLQPTSGYSFRIGTEQSVPVGSGSILFNRIRANYSYYMPVKLLNFDFMEGPQALAFNIQGGTVFGDLPPYEAFVLGGSNSIRGYAEGEAGNGRTYIQATAEYRFPIYSIVGGALFLDLGSTLGSQSAVPGKPGEVRNLPGSGIGYGVGVRIQSPVGPIRVDFGFNDSGDSRVHFGIGERF